MLRVRGRRLPVASARSLRQLTLNAVTMAYVARVLIAELSTVIQAVTITSLLPGATVMLLMTW